MVCIKVIIVDLSGQGRDSKTSFSPNSRLNSLTNYHSLVNQLITWINLDKRIPETRWFFPKHEPSKFTPSNAAFVLYFEFTEQILGLHHVIRVLLQKPVMDYNFMIIINCMNTIRLTSIITLKKTFMNNYKDC